MYLKNCWLTTITSFSHIVVGLGGERLVQWNSFDILYKCAGILVVFGWKYSHSRELKRRVSAFSQSLTLLVEKFDFYPTEGIVDVFKLKIIEVECIIQVTTDIYWFIKGLWLSTWGREKGGERHWQGFGVGVMLGGGGVTDGNSRRAD